MFTNHGITFGIIMTIILATLPTIGIMSSEMRKRTKFITEILMIAIIFFILTVGYSCEDSNWNDGYCIECGTKYECIGRSRTGEYDYCCPNCFHKATR